MQEVRKRFPGLKLTLREGHSPQLLSWLKNQELDLATTLLEGPPPPGCNWLPMLDLPLVLLVEKSSRLKSADELWRRDKIEETLISLPPFETIPKHFQVGLRRRGVDWLPRFEVSSLTLIEAYVANGYGIGLYVQIPKYKLPNRIRALPLEDFPPVAFGALWQGKLSEVARCVVNQLQRRVEQFAQ
jgi:DNA-binding transcriptional LysR family regulator